MVETPILFAPYIRPEYARKTFDAIKNAKPKKLYFYSDKAKEGIPEDIEKNNQIRAYINEIDWECDLKTFFRETHVGSVYTSLFAAFDWIFENEEQAIILEEDCVPSMAFFDFCDQLLQKYKDDQRIWVISGNNFIEGYNPNKYDYFYSYFPFLWGWATWKNRWHKVIRESLPYEKIKEYKLFNQIYANSKAAKQALKFTKNIINTPSWDYRFTISMKCNGGLGIIPKENLVSNIGLWGANSAVNHSYFHNRMLPVYNKYNICNPPPFVVSDFGYNNHWFTSYYLKKNKLYYKIKNRLLRFLVK